jgi:hypothetical protein
MSERGYWKRNIAIEEDIERFIIEIGSNISNEYETDTASECDDCSDTDTAEDVLSCVFRILCLLIQIK